jgi:L-iditol 2-dehydrogenase
MLLEDVPEPRIERDNMIVRIECCAICGSDIKIYHSGHARIKPPQIIGHEFAATVTELGTEVKGFRPGDRITMATSISCMECDWCRRGDTNLCDRLTPISSAYPGAYAEKMAVPGKGIKGGFTFKIPDNVPNEAAALAEPLSCVLNAQLVSGVRLGQTVVVVGAGPLGCLNVEAARALGATRVIVTQRSRARQELMKRLSVDAVIDASQANVAEEVRRLTNGKMADVVMVAAPTAEAQEDALQLARKNGVVNLFASLPKEAPFLKINSRLIHYSQISLMGAAESAPKHVDWALRLLSAGRINYKAIITHRFPLSKIMDGFRVMEEKKGLKVLIEPQK